MLVGAPPFGEEESTVHGEMEKRVAGRAAVEAQHGVAHNLRALDVEGQNARSGVDILRPC